MQKKKILPHISIFPPNLLDWIYSFLNVSSFAPIQFVLWLALVDTVLDNVYLITDLQIDWGSLKAGCLFLAPPTSTPSPPPHSS